MRLIVGLVVLLLGIGWAASQLPWPSSNPAGHGPPGIVWRRTRQGWEPAVWLQPPPVPRRPSLHPVVVGLFQMGVALVAWQATEPAPREETQRSR
ncbi:MAG TPA: hypothetical protein EYP56_21510 [Planctomycetaceae bacterium]|nr:hypothetical protein [Planctomycetaceae bacterium]